MGRDEVLQMFLEQEREELDKKSDLINDFTKYAISKGIDKNEIVFRHPLKLGLIAEARDISSRLNPTLALDKEGLVDFKIMRESFTLHPMSAGYFYLDSHVLMATELLRRSYSPSNNFIPSLIEIIWHESASNSSPHLRLDMDRVKIETDPYMVIEADTWFGAKFKENIADIDNGCVQLRPPQDIEDHVKFGFFSNVDCLDIKWEQKGNIKTFQAEEIKDDSVHQSFDGKDYYPARYLHAEYDLENETIRHFDGAVHFYTKEEHQQRSILKNNFDSIAKLHLKAESKKLFKFNGPITQDAWIDLSTSFMYGNPLVHEYFTGKYPDPVSEALEQLNVSCPA